MFELNTLEIESRNQFIENISDIYCGTYVFEQCGADVIWYPSDYEEEEEIAIELGLYNSMHFEEFMKEWKLSLKKDIIEYQLAVHLLQDIIAQDQVILLMYILGGKDNRK